MSGGSKAIIAVQLHRDGFSKPWGFRLQGGPEFNEPLTVQRVFMGSPSEGIIHRGDKILRINDMDASRVGLRDAENLVNGTALSLRLEVLRTGATSQPVSPQPMFHRQSSQHPPQPQSQQDPAWYGSPTHQAIQRQNSGGATDRRAPRWEQEDADAPAGIRNLVETERSKRSSVLEYTVPLPNPDHLSVKNQTYRTNQLISPAPKAKHYRPMGSYLDTSFNRSPRVIQDGPFNAGTRSFQRAQQRPQSIYDFNSLQTAGNQYASINNLSPRINGFQRQSSVSPAPRYNQQTPQKESLFGGRQWPPAPAPPSPPANQQPSNPFSFSSNGGGGMPSQTGSYYQSQPQSPQIYTEHQRPDARHVQQQTNQYVPQQRHAPEVFTEFQRPNTHRPQQQLHQPATVFNSGNANRKILHSNYNSPSGLYSAQNANAMFTGQTGLRDPNGLLQVNQPTPSKQLSDFSQSPTYQFLAQSQGQRGGTQWGNNPRQSRAMQSLISDL